MIGITLPMVTLMQLKNVILVPGGRGVSALGDGVAVLLLVGALEGRLAVLLYEVRASVNEDAR